MNSITETIDPKLSNTLYTNAYTYLGTSLKDPKKFRPKTWSLPFITGITYNIWWGTGIDFSHMSIFTTPLFTAEDKGIIFKFNYTQNRESFKIGPLRGLTKLSGFNYVNSTATYLDINTCTSGQNYHDNSVGPQRMMEICINGNNQSPYDLMEIYGIIC